MTKTPLLQKMMPDFFDFFKEEPNTFEGQFYKEKEDTRTHEEIMAEIVHDELVAKHRDNGLRNRSLNPREHGDNPRPITSLSMYDMSTTANDHDQSPRLNPTQWAKWRRNLLNTGTYDPNDWHLLDGYQKDWTKDTLNTLKALSDQ